MLFVSSSGVSNLFGPMVKGQWQEVLASTGPAGEILDAYPRKYPAVRGPHRGAQRMNTVLAHTCIGGRINRYACKIDELKVTDCQRKRGGRNAQRQTSA